MNKLLKIVPLMAGLLLVACNSGGSNWQQGNLGTLQTAIESPILNVGESTLVMATLSNAQQGTDAIGSATVTFTVANSYANGAFVPSTIATLSESSCVINNPIAADIAQRSCFVVLRGVTSGNSHVYVSAIPNSPSNTGAPTNYNAFESLPFSSFSIN